MEKATRVRRDITKKARLVVLKIGSAVLTSKESGLNEERLARLSAQIAALAEDGRQVVVVSSGAIATGMARLGLKERPREIPLKQAAASVGQSGLVEAYEKHFRKYGRHVAQVLLTHADLANRQRYLNARNTLSTLIELGVIPVINENDAVSVEELKFGDNDALSAMVASMLHADLLVILSDVDGLFTEDPRKNPDATLRDVVEQITPEVLRSAGGSATIEGTGGMASKVHAAKKTASAGIPTAIINGTRPETIASLFSGHQEGTLFLPEVCPLPSRKQWIAITLKPKGSLVLDAGATKAVRENGKSLLPSGVKEVHGRFDLGDVVSCVDPDGNEICRGLVNYPAADLQKIKGAKTTEIEKILGYKYFDEVIHRDDMVVV
ncbi:MAG: glutamate 5-kinase [Nitrospirota bacterium]|nr:glutamate 5-kinase [Nitrospirota bacterium]